MVHEILPVGALQCNCSIFGDDSTGEAIVVDPGDGDDLRTIQAILDRHQWKVTAIVITHAHIDHIGGAASLKAATGAPVYLSQRDLELYEALDLQAAWLQMRPPERTAIDVDPKDQDTLRLGGTDFRFLLTPGHTQGSLCLWIPSESTLIAGDTLFRDSIGRTDLPGGNSRQILVSIRDQLLPLPGETRVICGHGDATTIARERERNPFLRGLS